MTSLSGAVATDVRWKGDGSSASSSPSSSASSDFFSFSASVSSSCGALATFSLDSMDSLSSCARRVS